MNCVNEMNLECGVLVLERYEMGKTIRSVREMNTVGIDPNLFDDTSRDPIVGLLKRIHPTRGKDECAGRVKSRTPPSIG
jgi:hypothetical protein